MQLTLVVPLFAVLAFKYPLCGSITSLFLIMANVVMNMLYTYWYDLKIGYLNVNNYYFLGTIIAKPWMHI